MLKEEILKQYFGYTSFRKGQETLIDQVLQGKDVLGIMPTGAGKSLCYQVPALVFEGITIVVSPLISLMKDQVQALLASGVPAAFINSTLNSVQTRKAIDNAEKGIYKIIYVAPERLDTDAFVAFAAASPISMVAVDESHCVSQWGQNFRPSYLKINDFIDKMPKRPVIAAFTATATSDVRDDIIKILKLRSPYVVTTGFDRENLYFEVQKPQNKYQSIIRYLEGHSNQSGIIYCATRKAVEQVCSSLQDDGYNATRYHAGLSEQERTQNQDDFLYDKKTIMVATNAFGMGIDKSNVNFVIHYNMPKNMESYYQEAGRAGRDGTPADCILLYGGQDVVTNQFLIDHGSEQADLPPEILEQVKAKDRERLKQITYYCRTTNCLRAYMLNYFGEKSAEFCDNCGNCKQSFETVNILQESQKIISCICRMKERFGVKLVIDTLRGSRSERILKLHLNELSTYGIMKDVKESRIHEMINFLVLNGVLVLTNSEFSVVRLGDNYRALLYSHEPVWMKISKEPEPVHNEKKQTRPKTVTFGGMVDQVLFAKLKELRFQIAAENKVPAYVVFSDATLLDMCRMKPAGESEMLQVSGVGQVKLERYGERFLQVISASNQGNAVEQAESTVQTMEELCEYVNGKFQPFEKEVSVSVLADMLNSLLLEKSDCRISAIKLAKFYETNGFLQTETVEGKSAKLPTALGKELGIMSMKKIKATGESFLQNFYGEAAQCFAAEHIRELLIGLQ